MRSANSSEPNSSKKQGRPSLDYGFVLYRDLLAVYFYNESRKQGDKHDSAVMEAACKIRQHFSEAKISATQVKRALARHQGRGVEIVWTLTRTPDEEVTRLQTLYRALGLPEGLWANRPKCMLTISIGPRPTHARINARHNSHTRTRQS